jgi:phage head maturation protease
MDTITLSLTPEIHLDATAAGDDLPTRFSGVAYSGGLIPQFGGFGDAAIDLATLQPADKLFMLVNHDPDQRAGHGRVWVEGDQVRVEGQFARSTESGRQIAAEFKDGAPWQLSVGMHYQAQRPKGPQLINGQTLSVKTLFTHAAIREVSFVPVGADPNTTVAAFAADLAIEDTHLTIELEETINRLTRELGDAQAQLAAEKASREAAEATLQEAQASARLSAVKALFTELGRDFSDDAAQPYLSLSAEAFALLAGELRAMKPALDPALTRPLAVSGAARPDLAQLNAKLMAQVAGRKE